MGVGAIVVGAMIVGATVVGAKIVGASVVSPLIAALVVVGAKELGGLTDARCSCADLPKEPSHPATMTSASAAQAAWAHREFVRCIAPSVL